jgi:hypothetical protein
MILPAFMPAGATSERRQDPFLNFRDPDLVDKMIATAYKANQLSELKAFCAELGKRLTPELLETT